MVLEPTKTDFAIFLNLLAFISTTSIKFLPKIKKLIDKEKRRKRRKKIKDKRTIGTKFRWQTYPDDEIKEIYRIFHPFITIQKCWFNLLE